MSLQKLLKLEEIVQEEETIGNAVEVPANWPERGEISFKNV